MSKINKKTLHFGIIMPISNSENYTKKHWEEVKEYISESVDNIKAFKSKIQLVSEPGSNVIHQNIVKNLKISDIIICDISDHNPNVLFELGIRIAFNKPIIIIKDDYTEFLFDTSIIEHLEYPKNLHVYKMMNFKKKLERKIIKIYNQIIKERYSSFVQIFLDNENNLIKKTNKEDKIINFLKDIKSEINSLNNHIIKQKLSYNQVINITKSLTSTVAHYERGAITYKEMMWEIFDILADNAIHLKIITTLLENKKFKKQISFYNEQFCINFLNKLVKVIDELSPCSIEKIIKQKEYLLEVE